MAERRIANPPGRRSRRAWGGTPLTAALALAAAGCAGEPPGLFRTGEALIHGPDDRRELFEVEAADQRAALAEAMVALVPRRWIRPDGSGLIGALPSAAEVEQLCPDQRFAEQPAAAFCAGVLIDWDLVLTAGHCARRFAVQDFVALFDYHYAAPGRLAASGDVVREVRAILDERVDPPGRTPRLDYAWLRLARPVGPPRQPAPIFVRAPDLRSDDPLVAMATNAGVPFKLDAGGRIQEPRPAWRDYFVADTDTSHGASGGGAFDAQLVLAGVLARGGADSFATPEGCRVVIREPPGRGAAEQFTYAHQAVEALCAADPTASSICRPDCPSVCRALPPSEAAPEHGCAFAGGRAAGRADLSAALALLLVAFLRLSRPTTARRRLRGRPGG